MPIPDDLRTHERTGSTAAIADLAPLAGCILTTNGENNIERAVSSIGRAADVVFVLGSCSTQAVAEACGSDLKVRELQNRASEERS